MNQLLQWAMVSTPMQPAFGQVSLLLLLNNGALAVMIPAACGFPPVKQINRTNAQQLQRVWTYKVPTNPNIWIQAFESRPLMVDDVLYLATQTGLAIAVNAETANSSGASIALAGL